MWANQSVSTKPKEEFIMRKLMFSGVLTIVLLAFTVPLMAADWNFYGSVRMSTFYGDNDKDAGDDSGTDWDLQGNARIGANVKVDEAIGGRFEFAVTDESVSAGKESVNTRLLYATYKSDAGTLLLGQSYTPLADMFYSNQVYGWIAGDTDMLGVGQIWDYRRPLIMFSTKGLQIALVEVQTATALGSGGDVDVIIPKIELKYHFKKDNVFADIFGGYQSYKIEDIPGASDETISAYTFGVGGGLNFGDAYVKAGAYMARNAGQFGLLHITADDAVYAGGELIDNDTIGGLFVAGYKASDKIQLEAGVGYVASEVDDSAYEKDDNMTYYVQATYNIYKGFFIVPEVGVVDYGDNSSGASQGKNTYFGAKWQINF